jgi:hypothetical protein
MLPVRDNTPSRTYAASCFEDKDHTAEDSTAGENMMLKQPLITMCNEESLEGEGETKLQKERQRERQSKIVICKSFLLGSSIGFALQVMACAAYYTLFKMFAKDTQPTTGSLLSSFSYYLLVFLMMIDFVALLLTAKCFEWSDLIEQELEDDHSWDV